MFTSTAFAPIAPSVKGVNSDVSKGLTRVDDIRCVIDLALGSLVGTGIKVAISIRWLCKRVWLVSKVASLLLCYQLVLSVVQSVRLVHWAYSVAGLVDDSEGLLWATR